MHESISILLKILNNLHNRFHHLFALSYPVHNHGALLKSRPSVSLTLPAPVVCLECVPQASVHGSCSFSRLNLVLFLVRCSTLASLPQTPQLPSSLVWVRRLLLLSNQLLLIFTLDMASWPTRVVRFPPRLAIPALCGLVTVRVGICSRLSCPLDWIPGGRNWAFLVRWCLSGLNTLISVT